MPIGQIAQGIAALSAARQQRKISRDYLKRAGEWGDYQISEQAKSMLGEAQARRGAQMPGMGLAQAQMAQQQAGVLSSAGRGLGSGANYLALAAAMGAQGQQAGLNLAAQQAQYNEAQQQQLNQARGVMMGEEKTAFQNQLNRFQYFQGLGEQMRQASLANVTQGVGSIGQGVTDIFKTVAGVGGFGKGLQQMFGPPSINASANTTPRVF